MALSHTRYGTRRLAGKKVKLTTWVLAVCLAVSFGVSAPARAADATRYGMAFPGYEPGEEIDVDTLAFWVQWLRAGDYDVAGFLAQEATVDVILRDGESIDPLVERGFRIIDSEPSAPLNARTDQRMVPGGYVDPAALEAFMLTEAADHPDLTDLRVIGQTHEGRNIYALEISDQPGVVEDKPAILLNALHHAREVVTPHVVMDAITYLTDEYVAGNPDVIDWLGRYKILCVPMVNPDGSNRVHTVDDFHRKNMRPVCVGGNQGVDLNRNYPYHWGSGPENCERGVGSSGSICSSTYRGGSVGSEPETQAMMNLAAQERFVIAVSYHSSGRFIDYPYACNDGNPDQRMPEHDIIDELMHGTASAISAVDGVTYSVFSPIAIGPVNGDDTSWYYAHHGTYPLIIEVATSFQPAFSTGMASVARNRAGWLYLLDRLGKARIDVRVADHLTGAPLAAQVELLDFVFDTDELPRLSDPVFGRSRWLVPANDTYTVHVSAVGYEPRTLEVMVADEPLDVLVLLTPSGVTLGDAEPDGDIDMHDFIEFHFCLGEPPPLTFCRVFDLTADEAVTLDDWVALQEVLLGP